MKQSDTSSVSKAKEIFLGVSAALVLLILPMWGAEVMLFGAVAALLAYTFLFRQRLRSRGWLVAVISITVAAVLGAAVAAALVQRN